MRIRDNGPGIPEETMDQIFVPFFTIKKDGSGIGFGLSRQIMTAHRGEMVVESRVSPGEVKNLHRLIDSGMKY